MFPRHTKQIRTAPAYAKRSPRAIVPGNCVVARYAGAMHQIATGARDVGRGLGVLRAHPVLWRWVVAPAVITAGLIGALVAGIVHLVAPVSAWAVAHLPVVLGHVAGALLTGVVVVALAAGALLIFVPLAGMIAGPFNERLSEHVEAALTGAPVAASSLAGFVHGLALSAWHGARRLVAAVVGVILVFAVGFVPVIGPVAAAGAAGWFAATGAAYDCYDAVLARRAMSYGDKLAYLARHRRRTVGLGGVVAAMLFVPGLNLVALGLGAAGATVAAVAAERDAGRAGRR